jgi:dihydrofolate synthase / folylpolyglutamate synthase
MTYQETLAYIYGLARFGMRPGLERISAVLSSLGDPQKALRVVHVAGTNGKGSTAAFLAAIAAAGGGCVGLFTSPHLISFTERMRVNGKEIGEETVVLLAQRVISVAPPETTFFEIVTAMAFLYFAEEQVDLAIMEAGMGGRLDATNSASGILSVVTPISLDHCQYLGGTLADIALEKSGLIRPGCPVVVSGQSVEARLTIERRCAEEGSPCYRYGEDFAASWERDGLAYRGITARLSGLMPGIPGHYQAENAAAALCAAELLADRGFVLGPAEFRNGIESARWPGRMEMFGGSPGILLDGAHNGAGAAALALSLAEIPHDRLLLVAGVMGDKDMEGIMAPLLPLADRVFSVSPSIERALPSAHLADYCRGRGVDAVDAGRVEEGLSLAVNAAGTGDLVLVCGSLFTVGEARAVLLARHFEPCRG